MEKFVENNFATYKLERGIIHIIYKEDASLSLRNAMEVVAQRLIFQQGMAYPILCNLSGLKSIKWDAKRYLAVEGSTLIKALAFVSRTPLSIIFTKLYMKEAPPIEIGVFTEEIKALEFLSPFVKSSTTYL